MSEEFDQFSSEDLQNMRERFFQMKESRGTMYFDVDEYEALIDVFFEADDTENIEIVLNHALEQHPGNYDFLLKKAQLFAMYGQDEQGLQILDNLKGFAADADYFMIRGTLLSNLQKYREAIEEYTKALNSGQDLEEIYANIAFEYENLEQYDKAIDYLTKVVTINPENEAGLNEIGICFEMSNQSEKSIQYFNHFLDKHPYSRSAWFNLAIAFNSLGKNEKAIDAYEFSLAIDENQPSAFFNIANIYAGLENHPKAIDYYRRTLSKESPDAITYYYMGESYEKMDRFDDALECYTNSHHINTGFHEAILGMTRCHYSIGDEEEAFNQLDIAIKMDEPFPLFWSIRSLKLDELGFFKLAHTALSRLVRHYPDEIIYSLSMAVLYNNHDLEQSIRILDDIISEQSDSEKQALALFLKSLYLLKLGKEEDGVQCFKKAITLNKSEFSNPLIQSELNNNKHEVLVDLIKKHEL